jgi:hypothetical protein
MDVGIRTGAAMRTSGTAGLGAGTQRFVDNRLDGARAPAAFGAATEAAIDLLGAAGEIRHRTDGASDIVVGEDVTGTNNHESGRSRAWCDSNGDWDIEERGGMQKEKPHFQVIPNWALAFFKTGRTKTATIVHRENAS